MDPVAWGKANIPPIIPPTPTPIFFVSYYKSNICLFRKMQIGNMRKMITNQNNYG